MIRRGDIYWAMVEGSTIPHPYVVIQEDAINNSRVQTVVVCALTSNPRQANAPGNIRLDPGEGNVPKQSTVVVSKVSSVEKSQLGEYIGSLSAQRVEQILAGMRFLQTLSGHTTE